MALPLASSNGSLSEGLVVVDGRGTKVNGVSAEADASGRVKEVQGALANLAEQVAHQAERLVSLEQHVADLSKVLGQLGVEVDVRLGRFEQALQPKAEVARCEESGLTRSVDRG